MYAYIFSGVHSAIVKGEAEWQNFLNFMLFLRTYTIFSLIVPDFWSLRGGSRRTHTRLPLMYASLYITFDNAHKLFLT